MYSLRVFTHIKHYLIIEFEFQQPHPGDYETSVQNKQEKLFSETKTIVRNK